MVVTEQFRTHQDLSGPFPEVVEVVLSGMGLLALLAEVLAVLVVLLSNMAVQAH